MRQRLTAAKKDCDVLVARAAWGDVLAEAARREPLETGGILLGFWSPGDAVALVEAVVGPGPGARHWRHRFEPDAAWQHERLGEAYRCSDRITTYLGDWHTHPGGVPIPSGRDRRTARKIARERCARTPRPLMLIVGRVGVVEWHPVMYRWSSGRLQAVRLQLLDHA